ncbi:NUDIX hydrolase [Gordonia crocea]|uniref:MutT/NUDIX family protein n=1 Tax=Gordonia crocea TaxID=589162 RepID=A0A7M3SU60_9ACTN|nr:MutT/NUDIX family protein [Gordonia crocea]
MGAEPTSAAASANKPTGTRTGSDQAKPGPKPGPRLVSAPESSEPQPPKPSDLASTRGSHASATAQPDAGQRKERGKARNRGPRLRTVRETSAGGLVVSDLSRPYDELSAALIGRVDRRGRMMWSLPKGHIETGETAEQTAIREVAEETGIHGSVVAPLGKIDYWFVSEGRRIHKTVHHYLLRSTGGELSDADYEVAEVAWVPLVELPKRLTYSDERRLARMAEGVIAELTADPGRLAQSEADSIRTEPNEYEKAAAARNQRRKDPPPPPPSARRRRRRGRRPAPPRD